MRHTRRLPDGQLPLLFNADQAAAYIGIGRDEFRRLAKDGHIPQWNNPRGGKPRYSRLVLDDWSQQSNRRAS